MVFRGRHLGFYIAILSLAAGCASGSRNKTPTPDLLPLHPSRVRDSDGPTQPPLNKKLSRSQANIDITSYVIRLIVDPDDETLSGSVDVGLRTLGDTQEITELDLIQTYEVSRVSWLDASSKETDVSFEHRNDKLLIEYELAPQTPATFRVHYSGTPPKSTKPPWETGVNWNRTPNGQSWIGVNTEASGAQIWIPCKDDPSDEADWVRQELTVPNDLVVAANGKLIRVDHNTRGDWDTHIWQTNYPINNYNITFHVGDFVKHEVKSLSEEPFPIVFYAQREEPAAQTYGPSGSDSRTYEDKISHFMKQAQSYEAFLSKLFGPFPFREEKLGLAHSYAVGMEHQTMISYGANFVIEDGIDRTLLHEIAHEWWGNLITARKWEDIWIHEGLATYAEALYLENIRGQSAYTRYMVNRILPRVNPKAPVIVPGAKAQFVVDNINVYMKGAWVMHTLRFLLGDAVFFKALNGFATRFNSARANLVTTNDFITYIEGVSGQKLRWFFKPYLYDAQWPELRVEQTPTQLSLTWMRPDFNLPLDIVLTDGPASRTERLSFQGGKATLAISASTTFTLDPKRRALFVRKDP